MTSVKDSAVMAAFAALFAGAAAYAKMLLGPFAVLIVMMMLDYASGIASAWMLGTLSSRTGIIGIVKKVANLLIVAVGVAADYIIIDAAARLGMSVPDGCFVGLLVIVWLIINECISILENLSRMGLTLPPFLEGLIKHLKQQADEKLPAQYAQAAETGDAATEQAAVSGDAAEEKAGGTQDEADTGEG